MAKIGLDVSLQVCRDEGYMTMEYDARAFKKDPIHTEGTFKRTLTHYDREALGWQFNGYEVTTLDQCYNYEDLHETAMEVCDDKPPQIDPLDPPGPYDVLALANAVNEAGYLDTRGITLDQLKWINELKDIEWAKAHQKGRNEPNR